MHRRTYLGLATAALVGLAGCSSGGSEEYDDWFEDVKNYDGEVDRTGNQRVTVSVGTGDGFDFEPAAIRIDTGTTVVWEWTGQGGQHNVVARDGAFESEYHQQAGATFEHTFADAGLFPYYCEPHRKFGMKGGVRVE
jgi:halocyanin-like protein